MSDRYYWLKLHTGFFDSDDIRAIEKQENGAEYIIFWLKLLVRAIQQEEPGRLRFKETIPYTDSLLASVTGTDVDIVRSAMKAFQQLGMIEIVADGTIWIEEAQKMVGSECTSAERVRAFRARKSQLLLCNESVTKSNSESISSSSLLNVVSKSAQNGDSGAWDTFWQLYPRHVDKLAARAKWNATLKRGATEADLIKAAGRYAEACKRDKLEEKYIKHAKTFLGPSEPWREYLVEAPARTREEAVRARFGR